MAAVAPMDPPADLVADSEPTVQLECNLCPKKPVFSDSSHLLTHISSKGHLHQRFSTEFKAKSDDAAKEKLEKYEQWYKANDIERLLSERMSSKAKGRPPPRRPRAAAAAPRKSRARKSTSAVESTKADANKDADCRTPGNLPPMAHWNTAPVARDSVYPPIRDSNYLGGSLYTTPISMRQQSRYLYPEDVTGDGSGIKRDPFDPVHGSAPLPEIDSAYGPSFTDEDILQVNKLKGIVWPGMDLFDSATPDQKRKRNQRKDDAAIDQLKVTSENVTATETVWDKQGTKRKERDIYASPSSVEGTPPSTPPPRKRRSRARPNASSTMTPLSMMKTEDRSDDLSNTKRAGRLVGGVPKTRSLRASARAADKEDKNKDGISNTSIEDAVYALGNHKPPRSTFNVYYEGNGNSPGNMMTTFLTDDEPTLDPRFDQASLHNRPALQQLDPNLSIAESSPYFKHSTSSSHFFDNGSQSPHMAYRSTQQSSYGNGYQGMNNGTLNPLCTQPRSGGNMYQQFDNPMFNGSTGSGNDGAAGSFHGANSRRMGYGSFGIDANTNPFGYNDQRDSNVREGSYTDPSFQGTGRLFEL
ncbi:hypothetical protein SEUCBS139899_008734 [Sporothrix eucalyptigena]|uniref:C2h2 finger domain containing protein n=1 Tax=Sporothrix eucalyptigena TaxID=1812306 RepID=A0ABP0C5E2_9PEZI